MQKQLGTVGAESVLKAQVGDHAFLIVSDEPDLLDGVRDYSAQGDVEAVQEVLGFKISRPSPDGRLWTLAALDGAVLARSKTAEHVVAVLRRHLASISVVKPSAHQSRLALRAVIGPNGEAVLMDPRLTRSQPVIERSFAKHGIGVVDSLFVDLDATLTCVGREPNAGITDPASLVGHIDPVLLETSRVCAVLWAADSGAPELTPGQTIHAFASATRSGSREERLRAAVQLAESVPTRLLERFERGALFDALLEELG